MRLLGDALVRQAFVISAAMVFALSGCGGDDGDGHRSATPTATIPPAATATATVQPSSTLTPTAEPSPTPMGLSACAATADALFRACGFELEEDHGVAEAICTNESDSHDRAECFDDADASRQEATQLCADQMAARLDACGAIGDGRYDPTIDPTAFEDDFANLSHPNPYFPLVIGHRWEYRSATEADVVEIVNETKLIEGVRCIVARDQVSADGGLVESTDDWYAQAKDGNVWYFGEEAQSFESFDGDTPRTPELVSIEGSFKAGRDGDKPGIIFQAAPRPGQTYVEESSLGNAEDGAEILSTTYAFGQDPDLDRLVPRQLAEIFCAAGDCVVTRNFSSLEPGVLERKYYARGIGVVLETGPDTGEVNALVSCNFDARCASLSTAPVAGAVRGAPLRSAPTVQPRQGQQEPPCSATADALFRACGNSVEDDRWVAEAICINVSDDTERAQCVADADASRDEAGQLCEDQRSGRRAVCTSLGERRYDPDFDADAFDDDFTDLTHPNPYFPLAIGNRWEYRGGSELNTVEILNATKSIDDVTCIVAKDRVLDDGDLIEETNDWYAQAKDGNVWYCGEEVRNYETFDGDEPPRPELVSNEGSFKAGRDDDKPGIIFQASPAQGQVYVEEFSLGNAEDVTEVLSTTYSFGHDAELDALVPQPLAELLCSDDCVVTKNFSLLEPGLFARKYYARGIGAFLEVESSGEVSQLVSCNFDPRCTTLSPP